MELNGLDLEAMSGTVQAIQNDPSLAQFEFRARNRWVDGGENRSRIKDFYGAGGEDTSRTETFEFVNGEPPVLLGGRLHRRRTPGFDRLRAKAFAGLQHGLPACTGDDRTGLKCRWAARGSSKRWGPFSMERP